MIQIILIFFLSTFLFVEFLFCNAYGEDVYEYTSVLQIGHPDESDSNYILFYPKDMVVDSQKNIIILDSNNNRIVVYDSKFKFIRSFGRKGQGPGELMNPWFITLLGKTIIVDNTGNSRIDLFNEDGIYIRSIHPGFRVETLTVYEGKEILTNSNTHPKLVNRYDAYGHFLGSFGEWITTGMDDRDYITNTCIWLHSDSRGDTWLAFKTLPILRKYNSNGELLFEVKIKDPDVDKVMNRIAKDKVSSGGLTQIIHDVRTDKDNNLYVLILGKILIYDSMGKLLKIIEQNEKEEAIIFIDRILIDDQRRMYGLSASAGAVYRLDITRPK